MQMHLKSCDQMMERRKFSLQKHSQPNHNWEMYRWKQVLTPSYIRGTQNNHLQPYDIVMYPGTVQFTTNAYKNSESAIEIKTRRIVLIIEEIEKSSKTSSM